MLWEGKSAPTTTPPNPPTTAPIPAGRALPPGSIQKDPEHGLYTAAPIPAPTPAPNPAQGTAAFEIRDRLIELDDLRRRGILSEEEFAAKKSQLLDRI